MYPLPQMYVIDQQRFSTGDTQMYLDGEKGESVYFLNIFGKN